jgi:hypothetical protein
MNLERIYMLQKEQDELKADIAKAEKEAEYFYMMMKASESRAAGLFTQLRDVQINLRESQDPSAPEGDR